MATDLKALAAELEKLNQKNKRLEEKNKTLMEKEAILLSRLSKVQDEKSVSLIDNEFSTEVAEKDEEIYSLNQDIDMKSKENVELREIGAKLQLEIKTLEDQISNASDNEQQLTMLENELGMLNNENAIMAKAVYCILNNPKVLDSNIQSQISKNKEELEKIEEDVIEDLQKENKMLTARAEILRRQNEELHEFILAHFSIQQVNEFYNLNYPK